MSSPDQPNGDDGTRPSLFDQRAGSATMPNRRWLIVGVLLLAGILGGLGGLLLSQQDDPQTATTRTSTPATRSTVASSATAPSTSTTPATTSTTAATTSTTTTVAPSTTIAAETPLDPNTVDPAEIYLLRLGLGRDAAVPASAADVYAAWFAIVSGTPTVAKRADGYVVTTASGRRALFNGFVTGAEGRVSDVTTCVLNDDGTIGECRTLSQVIYVLSPPVVTVGQTTTMSAQRWSRFVLGPFRTATLMTYQSTKPIVSASAPQADRVDIGTETIVVTAATEVATADVTITYSDGTTELVTLQLI